MKLLSILNARAIWLFPLADLNPRGRVSPRNALLEIGTRYGFAVSPKAADVIAAREQNQPIKYLGGTFTPARKEPIGIDLLIYRDGIVADTKSSTGDSAEFIEDLLTWASKEFGLLPHGSVVKRKMSISEMHVSMDRALNLINPKLAAFGKMLSSKVEGHPGAQFELGALGFWADPILFTKPIPFRLERAEGVPFEENRYFSVGPLETEAHLELLEKLESLLS